MEGGIHGGLLAGGVCRETCSNELGGGACQRLVTVRSTLGREVGKAPGVPVVD